jgi:hypothetical protein
MGVLLVHDSLETQLKKSSSKKAAELNNYNLLNIKQSDFPLFFKLRITFAGFPTAKELSGMSLVTTELAPIVQPFHMVTWKNNSVSANPTIVTQWKLVLKILLFFFFSIFKEWEAA